MKLLLSILFLLVSVGCNKVFKVSETTTLQATCNMNNFEGFPEKVTGPVTLELKNFITILVKNKDKSEQVEMTFPKSKCGAN